MTMSTTNIARYVVTGSVVWVERAATRCAVTKVPKNATPEFVPAWDLVSVQPIPWLNQPRSPTFRRRCGSMIPCWMQWSAGASGDVRTALGVVLVSRLQPGQHIARLVSHSAVARSGLHP